MNSGRVDCKTKVKMSSEFENENRELNFLLPYELFFFFFEIQCWIFVNHEQVFEWMVERKNDVIDSDVCPSPFSFPFLVCSISNFENHKTSDVSNISFDSV